MGEKTAIILLSGGLDSTTTLAIAQSSGYTCYGLIFEYGQRHKIEVEVAKKIAAHYSVEKIKVINFDLGKLGGSALTDQNVSVPLHRTAGIPVTYVPARNTIFLSFALAWAEILQTFDIFLGVNAIDYSGYPDCRPQYIAAFERLANLATKAGVESGNFKIHAPLIEKSKAEIILIGHELNVDYTMTVSCYQADHKGQACGLCDACYFRKQGFNDAGIPDPTRYQQSS